ncbi:toll-like receptor 3 [Mytilus trossulus]|uniref:toll-like receptor 3 n=1 Tax=Mytilus trossulus TaxID=6551 RepID=UPI003007D7D4
MKFLILYLLMTVHEATSYTEETKCSVQNDNIDCSHLDLTTIPRHLPVNATSLNLIWNSIKIVKSFSFKSLRYITYLDLGRNVIELIEINAFHGLHRLRTLHLHDNVINVFPDGMFERLNGLQVLSIDGNKLKYFQDDKITKVSKIVSLTTLSFDVYPDFKFPRQWGTLSKLTDLRIFAMSAKVKFNKAMFVHVNMMQTTALSINVVPFISEDFFEHFPKLESITLSIGSDLPNNPIDQVFKSFGIFRGKNISNLEIRSGRFDNWFILNYKRMRYLWSICLKRLTLNNLYIKDIPIYAMQVFCIKSTCLEYLEFSDNIMFDRGAAVVAVMNNLKNLKVLKITRNWRNSRRKRSQPSKLYNFVLPKTLEELYIEHNMDGDMADVEVVNGFNLRVLSLKDNEMWSCIGTFTGIINVEYTSISWNF